MTCLNSVELPGIEPDVLLAKYLVNHGLGDQTRPNTTICDQRKRSSMWTRSTPMKGTRMNRNLLTAVAAAALALGGIVTAAPAVAGPCLFQGDWNCSGQPRYNGPLQDTWDHGYTTMPQICPGGASLQPCQFYVTQP